MLFQLPSDHEITSFHVYIPIFDENRLAVNSLRDKNECKRRPFRGILAAADCTQVSVGEGETPVTTPKACPERRCEGETFDELSLAHDMLIWLLMEW